ncbi:MAG: CPBP family intramembrane metalloprotease [Bacteroidaceae bacterium]|nr:CPBP family intramembrane metalloprotease [Bacteroidaceae bacterium]
MKKVVYPIFAVIVFIIMQAMAGVALVAVGALRNIDKAKAIAASGDSDAMMRELASPDMLALAIVVSGILTIIVIALLKMIDWKQVLNVKTINWSWGAVSIVAAFAGIFALDIAEEMLDLPNLMEDTFTDMSNSVMGALGIGLLGPIIEEFIFREGIEGYMLRNGVNKWVAIVGSALAFGIIHLNPAQVPFAAAMGIILGVIYYKTGNIVITSILHILNNSIAVWQMYTLGDAAKDFSLVESIGGTTSAIILMIVGTVVCVTMLISFWKKYQQKM